MDDFERNRDKVESQVVILINDLTRYIASWAHPC